jgi:hypothetical protein
MNNMPKIDPDGTQRWYNADGLLHRDAGPAAMYANGTQQWWFNGQLHRTDGPAVVLANGTQEWYQNDKLHRDGGPAVIFPSGIKRWYQNGRLHRTDGPAVVLANGTQEWYLDGQQVDPLEHLLQRCTTAWRAKGNSKEQCKWTACPKLPQLAPGSAASGPS